MQNIIFPDPENKKLNMEVGDEKKGAFAPAGHRLAVLWEDEDILIINKPADMAVHGRSEHGEPTVGSAVAAYLGTAAPFHPVNRLDRGTTGVMCAAKTGYMHERLRRLLHTPGLRREYLAISVGVPEPASGVIDLPIGRRGEEKRFCTRPAGAPSLTRYETLPAADGLALLRHARSKTGLPIVTEIMNPAHIPLFEDVDLIQVGARNMQNFELLKELGKLKTPVLLKRGLANTLEEFLMSAEYIMAGGNENVILCERGIRTFEPSMRNTLDISAVPMLKQKTHLPVVVDPSHAAGIAWLVRPLAMAAIAAGADGLMIEVHNDPAHAKSDGAQSLTPAQFRELMADIRRTAQFFGRAL